MRKRILPKIFMTAAVIVSAGLALFTACDDDFWGPIGPPSNTTYTVSYSLNGGSGTTPSSQTVNSGNCVTLNYGGGFSRNGYTFGGWNTNSSGSGNSYSAGSSFCPSGSITLYARWTATITYNLNGGSGSTPSSQTVNAGNSVTVASGSGFSRSGYPFAGWNTNSSGTGTNYSAGTSFTPSGSVTLYAMWTLQPGGQFNPNISYGSFTDSRDGKSYRTVVIGGKRWMAENLNYDVPGVSTDVCYNDNSNNCDLYGRLYDWVTAMNLPSSCNNSSCVSQVQSPNHQGICPNGWHVPSDAEWTALADFVGGWETAGTRLKSTSGWSSGNGMDDYGFSALPGGGRWEDGSFYNVGDNGNWWSATEYGATNARYRHMSYGDSRVYSLWFNINTYRFSLRCVAD